MDRTSTPEDTVGAVRSVVQKQTVAFGFGRYRESPGVQAILRSLDIERDGADSKGVRPLTLAPSTLPFSSRRFRIRTRSTDAPPDIIVDKTAQFVAKVCCASPTTLIRSQQHIHTRQPTLPRKIYFGLTAHPPSATRPQHTQLRTPQLRTYITKSRDYTTITS